MPLPLIAVLESGFELVDIGLDRMDAFMKERAKHYAETARRVGLVR
jgi:hypothetical protein